MERDLRETFQAVFDRIDALKDSQIERLDQARQILEGKIENLRQECVVLNQFVIKLTESTKTTRSKLDEHLVDHREHSKWWGGILAALVVSAVLGIWAWIKVHVFGNGPTGR